MLDAYANKLIILFELCGSYSLGYKAPKQIDILTTLCLTFLEGQLVLRQWFLQSDITKCEVYVKFVYCWGWGRGLLMHKAGRYLGFSVVALFC